MVKLNDFTYAGGFSLKNYLERFFCEFEYEQDDSDYLSYIYELILNDKDADKCMLDALSLYNDNIECDYDEILKLCGVIAKKINIHEFTIELLMFICMSKRLSEIYNERGIDREIFHNSMLDLKYKLDECKLVMGIKGSFVAFWFAGFFNMTRFALGRLQFEVIDFNREYTLDGYKLLPKTKVLNVHIPRTGTPLFPEECQKSYIRAAAFFENEVGKDCFIVCDSWLLNPEHRNILPEKSNIRRFMEQFEIINHGIYRDNRELWRLFDTKEQNPERLPANSTVRRIYINHLKSGGRVGWGYGIINVKSICNVTGD